MSMPIVTATRPMSVIDRTISMSVKPLSFRAMLMVRYYRSEGGGAACPRDSDIDPLCPYFRIGAPGHGAALGIEVSLVHAEYLDRPREPVIGRRERGRGL